ncbi:MAG: aminopeptidase P family protein [Phycisphaerae bacterium]|nr:aminopeptidase P family protein [Phycisphaerae bacterium]
MDEGRLERLKAAMEKAGLEAVFVSNPKNVKYLTGFKTMLPGEVQGFGDPEGFTLIHAKGCDFLCDGRYIEGVRQLSGVTGQLLESPVTAESIAKKIQECLPSGVKTMGFERDALLYIDGVGLIEHMKGVTLKPAEDVFSDLRIRKTPEEIELLRKAEAITSDCFEHIAQFIRVGMTERDVALEIDQFMRTHSEGCSFDPIAAFGETSCHPHYVPDPSRKLKKGQIVLLDLGSIHEGYAGDMTRMICMGKADKRLREVYDIVLEAQLAGLEAVRPGVTAHDIDMAIRNTFEKYGCLDKFPHGTGHGVGLAIHEAPRIKQGFETVIEPGMVFTVEPGLYYAGWGGVRIEDMVAVTETGYENLTTTPKELRELDV